MPIVSEVITHLLKHVNAEAANTDQTQTPGMSDRAQFARDSNTPLLSNNADVPIDGIYGLMITAVSGGADKASYVQVINDARTRGDQRPQLVVHGWVAREEAGP